MMGFSRIFESIRVEPKFIDLVHAYQSNCSVLYLSSNKINPELCEFSTKIVIVAFLSVLLVRDSFPVPSCPLKFHTIPPSFHAVP